MRTSVAVFCGGRGAASIVRALLATRQVDVSLLINGYDNGLSTGTIRRSLPGILGPSDFRKSLTLHLDPSEPHHDALLTLLTHRLPDRASMVDLELMVNRVRSGSGKFAMLSSFERHTTRGYLDAVRTRLMANDRALDLTNCSLGNLLIAGAYLCHGQSFNVAVEACARLVSSPLRLLNVTEGENAYLVARKVDGRVLIDESDIVGVQDRIPISELLLVAAEPRLLAATERRSIASSSLWDVLTRMAAKVTLSSAADKAIREADLLVYGPGTPHSSLLPSYLTPGIAPSIQDSRARAKVFVANLIPDHDVPSLGPTDLARLTLRYLADLSNQALTMTHALCDRRFETNMEYCAPDRVAWITGRFSSSKDSALHDGPRTAAALLKTISGSRTESSAS